MRVKNFLKSDRHLHKDPSVRLERLRELDPEDGEHQSIIAERAVADDDPAVRLAAIERLTQPDVFLALLDGGELTAPALQALDERLSALLVGGGLDERAVGELMERGGNDMRVRIAVHCAAPMQREHALAALDNETDHLQIVQQSRYHDTRLAAAERLTRHDSLRAALNACRARDKDVARRLQQRLDAESAAEAAEIAAHHEVTTTLAAAEQLAESVWSPQTAGRLASLQQRWNHIDGTIRAAQNAPFEAALARVRQRIEAHQAALDEQADTDTGSHAGAADDAAVSAAASGDATGDTTGDVSGDTSGAASSGAGSSPEDAGSTRQTPTVPTVARGENPALDRELDRLAPLGLTALPGQPIEPIAPETADGAQGDTTLAATLRSHAEAVAVLFDPPFDIQKARPGSLSQRMRRVDALCDTDATLPGIDVSSLTYIAELREHRDALASRLGKAEQESADRVKATHRQFAALSGIIGEGKWGPANSMLRRLKKKIGTMEASEKATLTDKLARAEKQLADMADWQDFAARPKLEALCEQMEALTTAATEDPEALSRNVKALQQQWKSLGPSRAANELWPRFKTAGDTAYEPCKAYFAGKQDERDAKLSRKGELCEALETLAASTDWDNADWKVVQREVNNAKREWSRNRVTDRKPDKSLEKRFSDALQPFESRLAAQYDANRALKEELVEKVAALAAGEINQHSVNQTRSLQSAWKQVGVTRRKEDQSLWEAFNGHCRVIYKHQHESERERYKASMGHVFRARDIIKSLQQMARGKGDVDEQAVQALSTEFQGLAEFPEKERKFLQRDFRKALDAFSAMQDNRNRQRASAQQAEQQRLVSLCEQLETAVEFGSDDTATLIDDVTHAWDASEVSLSKDIAAALAGRRDAALAHLAAGTRFDYSDGEEARRDLLVRMEVEAGIDTPAEDRQRRMAYQLAHLQEGMTSARTSDARTRLKALELDWLTLPPAPGAVRDALHSRYLKAVGR